MDAGVEQNGTDYCCSQCNADLASGEVYDTAPNPDEERIWITRFITHPGATTFAHVVLTSEEIARFAIEHTKGEDFALSASVRARWSA
jgi:hypothetical protein